jgi:hypothetical protein
LACRPRSSRLVRRPDTDDASVVWFRYTPGGLIISRDYSNDPADIRLAREQRDLALEHSLRLSEFLTSHAAE